MVQRGGQQQHPETQGEASARNILYSAKNTVTSAERYSIARKGPAVKFWYSGMQIKRVKMSRIIYPL